jgi:hypothetical protein
MAKMSGNTQDAAVPILKQAFWTKGTELSGLVVRRFATIPEPGKTAMCIELKLPKYLNVDATLLSTSEKGLKGSQRLERIAIGEMTGLMMAINAAGTEHLTEGDVVDITCLGSTDTGKGNPRTDFKIEIERPDRPNADKF